MPVGANIRVAPGAAEPVQGAAGEAMGMEELFGEMIASLGQPADEAAAAVSAPLEAAQTPTPKIRIAEVPESVEQLLAVAAMQQAADASVQACAVAPSEPGPAPAGPEAVTSAEAPARAEAAILALPPHPTTAPAAVDAPQAAAATSAAAPAKAEAPAPAASAAEPRPQDQPKAQVQGQPHAPQAQQSPAQQAQAPQPQAVQTQAQQNQAAEIASPRTETAVQLALSSLEAVVKTLPARGWAAAAAPRAMKQAGEEDSAAPIHDVKAAALTPLAQLGAMFAPLEQARPLERSAAMPIEQAPEAAPSELLVEHQLDLAHEGEWLDQLARDIAQTAGGDKTPLRFRLNPETLGSLRVEITQDRNGTAVRLTADSEAARAIIADAQPRLIAEARAQGIRISETHVDLGSQSQSGDPRRQNAVLEEAPLRTARSLQEEPQGDGNPTPGRSERYA
jgi:flagellar hook-length control protein FliK